MCHKIKVVYAWSQDLTRNLFRTPGCVFLPSFESLLSLSFPILYFPFSPSFPCRKVTPQSQQRAYLLPPLSRRKTTFAAIRHVLWALNTQTMRLRLRPGRKHILVHLSLYDSGRTGTESVTWHLAVTPKFQNRFCTKPQSARADHWALSELPKLAVNG